MDKNCSLVKWISVKDKLPTKDGKYLCTYIAMGSTQTMEILYFSQDLYKESKYYFERYKGQKKAGFYISDSEFGDIEYDEVIAWAELPKIYEE